MKLTKAQKEELAVWMENGKEAYFRTLKRIVVRRGWVAREDFDNFAEVAGREIFKKTASAAKLAGIIEVVGNPVEPD